MSASGILSSQKPSRATYSCIRCADRKVRCDRQRPCSSCVKHNVDCIFNPSPPTRKRQKRAEDRMLADRLRHLESLLHQQGIDPSKLPDDPSPEHPPGVGQLQTPTPTEEETNQKLGNAHLVQGQRRPQFVENVLWTSVVEQFHDPENDLRDDSDDGSDLDPSDDDSTYVLNNAPDLKMELYHPQSEVIHQLWRVFVENVDPMTKAVHVPTLQPAIEKAARDIQSIPWNFEALMFSIYSAAIMSLKNDDCQQRFGASRKALLSRYNSATKAALSRAKFMSTTDLVILQALVLHLLSVRDIYEPRAIWSLTGIAVRIAQSMGLERDGLSLGLPPFETEMRRRVWWLLKTHDFRTAELCGLAKFRDVETGEGLSKFPTNINDRQLFPGMTSLTPSEDQVTDSICLALRYELTSFAADRVAKFRQEGKDPSQWNLHVSVGDQMDRDMLVKKLEEKVETKYLRYLDPTQPLHLLTLLLGRFALNIIRFYTHHPRRWVRREEIPLVESQLVWNLCLKLLEQQVMLLSNPQLKRFSWHAPYFQQWHALIHVLVTLRASPHITDHEKAWQLINDLYESSPDMIYDTRKPIYVAVGNLCLKAYAAYGDTLQDPSSIPDFIQKLRHQRTVIKAKREARNAKKAYSKIKWTPAQSTDFGVANLGNTLDATYLHQNASPPTPSNTDSSNTDVSGITQEDPFWFVNGFDGNQAGSIDGTMDLDMDFTFTPGQDLQGDAAQAIDWAQWDAWVANSNIIRPLAAEETP